MAAYNPYRTSSDLVLGALSELGVTGAGQSVSPEDFETISGNLDSLFRKLAALEIVYVADPNNIPGEWFMDLVLIVAGENASGFGAVGQELDTFINRGLGGSGQVPVGAGAAAQSLKIILLGRPTGEPLRTHSF
jgi:hypothetical protein